MAVLSGAEPKKQAVASSAIRVGVMVLPQGMNWRQILTYLVVGGLNTALSLGVYFAALAWLHLPYYAASAVSIVLGIIIGFKAHGAFVFGSKGSFIRYVTCWVLIYLGNTVAIALIRDVTGDYWAQIILLPFTTVLSYFLMKTLVYRLIQTKE